MQKLKFILLIIMLLIIICITQQGYTQTSSFWIPLQKQPRGTPYTLLNNRIYEIEDISGFKIPEGIDNFVIGYLKLSYYHDLYNARYFNDDNFLKYQSAIEENNIDTSQFAHINLKKTDLYVLIYMQNGVKHLIIDTDFDNSFINEQVHKCKFKKIEKGEDEEYIFTELKLLVDSFQTSIFKVIPVNILMNESRYSDNKIGKNDSLQVYITQNFDYQGYFIDDTDTVFLTMTPQRFDLFYTNNRVELIYMCKSCQMTYPVFFIRLGDHIRVKNHVYLFEEFDIINKRVKLTRLADNSIGTQPGSFLDSLPELNALSGYSLLNFTGSWCKPCRPVLDSLLVFYKRHPEITIININQENDSLAFVKYVEHYKIPWKIIYDKTFTSGIGIKNSLYHATYNNGGVPTLLLVNPKRRILRVESEKGRCIELLKEIEEKGCAAFEIFD